MQPRHFTLERLVRASSIAARLADERTVLRINRDALKGDEPRVRFEAQD
jgi:hypothetical protein